MSEQLDCVVVGAGVIGLAVGRSLAISGREVAVLEAESEIGMHTSSRNSEVIHAGLYYGDNSLKAMLCVQGRERLYQYCEDRRIPHQRIGKLIIASNDDEYAKLKAIHVQAVKNGVDDLAFLDAAAIKEFESAVTGSAALISPSTGIIDSHSLMNSLHADIEEYGGTVLTHSLVSRVAVSASGFRLNIGGVSESFNCKTLINSAGLRAAELAAKISQLDAQFSERVHFAKGHYYSYQGKSPFNHLIYPIPIDGGLGVHATNDMGGGARFGPDVEWVDAIDYDFDETRKCRFVESIKMYFPDLDESKLTPAYTGIRPKLSGPGALARDFVIQGPSEHGVDGLVNLFGIDSPGLTASLAIGDFVKNMLQQ